MNFSIISGVGALLFALDLAIVVLLICIPIVKKYDDDQGDGRARVVLPKSVTPPPVWRTGVFLSAFSVLSLGYVGLGDPTLNRIYGEMVGSFATLVVRDPSAIAGYIAPSHLGTRFIILAYILSLALAVRAGALRRLLLATQAVWYLLLILLADALLIVIGVVTGWPVQPFGLQGNLVATILGIVVFTRLTFVTFALPRPVAVVRARRRYLTDTVMMICLIAPVLALFAAASMIRATWVQVGLVPLIAGLLLPGFIANLINTALFALRSLGPPPPPITDDRPPIDIIAPAYNEEVLIGDHLRAVDRAACRYGGPVRIILANDGSTDRTEEIARSVIAGYQCATGEIIAAGHSGKTKALNAALARTTADIVIRVDADVVIDDEALLYAHRWFKDPSVGMVSALNLPLPGPSWFHRMRLFECLAGFGFARQALQVADAIQCVPGTFTAFRRAPIVDIGGFADGMNGEDADLTMLIGRLGYRVVLDRKVRDYEDVPPTLARFREQRLRWNRAGIHVFARHAPFRAGSIGPRAWYTLVRLYAARVISVSRLLLTIHVLQLVVLVPTYRKNLAVVVALFLITLAPSIFILGLLGLLYRRGRFAWLPTWYLFATLRRVFVLEALLTLPTRPVHVPLPKLRSMPRREFSKGGANLNN